MRGSIDLGRILIIVLPALLLAAAGMIVISTYEKPFISYQDCLEGNTEEQRPGIPCSLEGCPVDNTLGIIKEDGKLGVCCPVECKEDYGWA